MESIIQTEMKREQREDEHLEMICWIEENKNYEFPFMIIKGEDYDNWLQSDNEDEELKMILAEYNEFYEKFKEITGVDLMNLNHFISISYIDESRNDIELVVNITGNNKRFIIGV